MNKINDDSPRGYTESEWQQIVQENEVRRYPGMARKFAAMEQRAELQRLKDAVVEAAKTQFRSFANESHRAKEHYETINALSVAVGALLKFEARVGGEKY